MGDRPVPQRQRRAVMGAALLPAAVGVLKLPVAAAGRWAWLCPLFALPAGLLLCLAWSRGGAELLEERPGPLGWCLQMAVLVWGVVLLWGSAGRFSGRLLQTIDGGAAQWALLGAVLLLTLYLTRRGEILARAGTLFFWAVAVTLGATVLLALPSLRWENLTPLTGEELKGVPAGAAWVLSLAGYAVYGAFLPVKEKRGGGGAWCLWLCGALTALLGAVVGAFGPALALRMDDPFLYLLGGVGVPGAFQRGEAMLSALAALGDLALFGLLANGCAQVWKRRLGGAAWLPAAAGFALAVLAPEAGAEFLAGRWGLAGNLVLGSGAPLFVVLTRRTERAKKEPSIFCGEKTEEKEDVGAKWDGKKSSGENEKKC